MTGRARYNFSSTTAIITGAAGDIGRAVATRLAAAGANVSLWDLPSTGPQLADAADACRTAGAPVAHMVHRDVTDSDGVATAVDEVADQVGVPNLVFNNAGYQGAFVPTADYPLDDARQVIDVNVLGVTNVLQATARLLRASGMGGSIVNAASMAGVSGAPNMLAYSASKAAVIGLTRTAARDLAVHGIRVNAVSPAFIGPGAMWERQVRLQADADSGHYSSDPAQVADEMLAQIPMGRLGSVEEVAAAVVWLLSDEASYVTGANLVIAGGIT